MHFLILGPIFYILGLYLLDAMGLLACSKMSTKKIKPIPSYCPLNRKVRSSSDNSEPYFAIPQHRFQDWTPEDKVNNPGRYWHFMARHKPF